MVNKYTLVKPATWETEYTLIPQGLTFEDVLLRPRLSRVNSRNYVDLNTIFSRNVALEIPLVSSPMNTVTGATLAKEMAELGGLGIIHRFQPIENIYACVSGLHKMGCLVGAALGISDDYIELAVQLYHAGVPVLVMDVANAYTEKARDFFKTIRSHVKCDIVVGSIATKDAAELYTELGADGLRIGIGNGSICTTRVVTGVGVPQLSAVMECAADSEIPVISDGGLNNSGDIVKALAAGASSVMSGSLFAGVDESIAVLFGSDKGDYASYKGMASSSAMTDGDKEIKSVEGVETKVLKKGPLSDVVNRLVWGIKSGCTYLDAYSIEELQAHAEFVRISPAGWRESLPVTER